MAHKKAAQRTAGRRVSMLIFMLSILLIITTVLWVKNHFAVMVIMCYMAKKDYEVPNKEECEECTKFVLQNFWDIVRKSK